LDANVSGKVVEASSFFSTGSLTWTAGVGVDAPKGLEFPAEEKGLAEAVPFGLDEKGFANGFAGVDALTPFLTPNKDSPILGCGFSSSLTSFFSILAVLALLLAPLAMRTPRMPLTLPSFLLHGLRRHVQM
jgi:hypothetical protein